MDEIRSFKNASYLMAGGACMVMLIGHIFNSASSLSEPIVPGFRHLTGLCIPVLCFWFGMAVRALSKAPLRWAQILLPFLSVFCLYKFHHELYAAWRSVAYLYVALICIGYLVPRKVLFEAHRRKGWEYLALLLLAASCYAAVSVVRFRLEWLTGSYIPEHQDMLRLMLTLMRDIGPLLVILVLYFVIMFSCSRFGQWLGERSWFRGIVLVGAVFQFIVSISNLIIRTSWADFIIILVQPVTVGLAVLLARGLKKLRKTTL